MENMDELKALLNKKLNCLNNIFELTKKQIQPIQSIEMDKLNSLIQKKQEQIDEVDKIDEMFENKFRQIKVEKHITSLNELGKADQQEFKIIQIFIQEIQDTIKNIIEIEEQNNQLMKHFHSEIKESMQNAGKDKKILNGYGKETLAQHSMFFDKKK